MTFDGTLDPGDEAFFISVYKPKRADANETDPSQATFTDRVDGKAVGAISGDETTDFATASCSLCPPPARPRPPPPPPRFSSRLSPPRALARKQPRPGRIL